MPKVGTLGLDMMHRTCTVQVNLDFESERDMVRKFRTSLALQPVATALFAASPFTAVCVGNVPLVTTAQPTTTTTQPTTTTTALGQSNLVPPATLMPSRNLELASLPGPV